MGVKNLPLHCGNFLTPGHSQTIVAHWCAYAHKIQLKLRNFYTKRRRRNKLLYIDVGDQKFISRSSDGLAFRTLAFMKLAAVLVPAAAAATDAADVTSIASSASSLMFETELFDVATSR